MGNGTHYTQGKVRMTKSQMNRIKPTRQYGEWYAQVDPDTGAIKWIRKKIKRRK